MSIYETSVKRPITTALIFIGISIIGLFAFSRLSIDLLPDTDPTNVMVITSYAGASAEDIESNVSKVLENGLNSVENLKHISSINKENTSIINLEFEAGTDIVEATNDIRDKLDAVSNVLPSGINRPVIFKFGADDIPVAILYVKSQESFPALKKILENKITNHLERIEGVGSVNISGNNNRQIQVYCDPLKLQAYDLSIDQVGNIIRAENRNISAGNMDIGSKTLGIRVEGEFDDPLKIGDIAITNRGGHTIYLKDIAKIEDTSSEYQQEVYNNGERGAIIVVKKQSGGNSVDISKRLNEKLPSLVSSLPSDMKIEYLIDTSDIIVNTINSLKETIFVTFIVVMLVVFLFLGGWKSTMIIIITIPVSLIASFIYLMASGNSLNVISLSSLSIAIGMVVDDAIVVLENISTHIKRGGDPKQSSIYATNEVGLSVVASTLTMLAVFLPLTMIRGQAGLLFRQLGWIISVVMIVSTFAALTLIPMLSSVLLKSTPKESKSKKSFFEKFNRGFEKVENAYSRLLTWAVRHRKAVIITNISIFVFSLLLVPFIKTEFMTAYDNGFLSVSMELPVGTNLETTRSVALRLDSIWRKDNPEIKTISMTIGQADASNTFATIQDNGNNIISVNIGLTDVNERERSNLDIADYIRKSIANTPEIIRSNVKASAGGAAGESVVDVDVFGYDFNETDAIVREIKNKIEKSPICAAIKISRKDYIPEYEFVFDRDKLAEHGLNISSASQAISNNVNGMIVSYFREDGDEYAIRVSSDPKTRQTLKDVENYDIRTPKGDRVRIGDLGYFKEKLTPPTIERKDRSRVVTLSATVSQGYVLSDLVDVVKNAVNTTSFPASVSYKIGGTYETQQDTFSELFLLMALVIILVFIVMASQFESLTTPFVIMFSVPFAFTGVFLGLLITQIPMGAMALIGLIMLIGIVVKNGIVLIDYTKICQERGMGVIASVVDAGKARLRPVVMTTLTTVLGMIPLAIGIGQGSEMWQSMGVTVAFGLTFSTLITLVLIPTVYASFAGISFKRAKRKKILAEK